MGRFKEKCWVSQPIFGLFLDSFFSNLKKKNGTRHGVVLNGTVLLLLPLDAQRQGKKRFVPLYFPTPSLSQNPKNQQDTHPLNCQDKNAEETSPAGGSGAAAQWPPATLPLCHEWTGVVGLSLFFHPYK